MVGQMGKFKISLNFDKQFWHTSSYTFHTSHLCEICDSVIMKTVIKANDLHNFITDRDYKKSIKILISTVCDH